LHYVNVISLIFFNLFGAVFRGQWVVIVGFASFFFYVSAYLINIFKENDEQFLLLGFNFLFILVSLTITYFIRWLLAKAFTFQIVAE
jgi:hypothetical protein